MFSPAPKPLVVAIGAFLLITPCAQATYSIVACDLQTRACGVAVQTNNLAVGASVPCARAGVGALASQYETNPMYGPRGLALLAQGKSPDETMKQLLAEDGNFEGRGTEARQVGIVSIAGLTSAYTGRDAGNSSWAGARTGNGYSVQGNGLAGPQVVDAMEQAFLKTSGTLAERLMDSLIAGDHAGGQSTGRESAALLVRVPGGFPLDIDLRVDSSADPVADLNKLLSIQIARQTMVQARIAARNGNFEAAKSNMIAAISTAPDWPRIWTSAARIANDIEEPSLAIQYLSIVFHMNPAWIEAEIGEGNYAELGADPIFHRWLTPAQEAAALDEYRKSSATKAFPPNDRQDLARKLLEGGKAKEALALLDSGPSAVYRSSGEILLRASANTALGQFSQALDDCRQGLRADPANPRLQIRAARLAGLIENLPAAK